MIKKNYYVIINAIVCFNFINTCCSTIYNDNNRILQQLLLWKWWGVANAALANAALANAALANAALANAALAKHSIHQKHVLRFKGRSAHYSASNCFTVAPITMGKNTMATSTLDWILKVKKLCNFKSDQ